VKSLSSAAAPWRLSKSRGRSVSRSEPPRIVLDGCEDIEGRALLLVSALHFGAAALAGWKVSFVVQGDAVVCAALDALRWDTGLDVEWLHSRQRAVVLPGARLFAAVCFRDSSHLNLADVARHGVPALVAIQFPDFERHGPEALALQRAAHDPRLLCAEILARLGVALP
jgi:hypothetical protein